GGAGRRGRSPGRVPRGGGPGVRVAPPRRRGVAGGAAGVRPGQAGGLQVPARGSDRRVRATHARGEGRPEGASNPDRSAVSRPNGRGLRARGGREGYTQASSSIVTRSSTTGSTGRSPAPVRTRD